MSVMTAPAFPVTVNFTWVETNVIPPRCRKPRNVEHPGQQHTVCVPTATPEEAPVAFRVHPGNSTVDTAQEWRYYNGRLFAAYMPNSRQTEITVAGSPTFPSDRNWDTWWSQNSHMVRTETLDQAKSNIDSYLSNYLIVNGEVWVQTEAEPCYRVDTYGHNDTLAYLHVTDCGWTATHGEWKYYNANERQEAIAAGMALVPDYRREESQTRMKAGVDIEVLIPEAVKFHPDRITAKGRDEISGYAYRNSTRTREAFEIAATKMDAGSVGRGETGYADYLEQAAAALMAEAARIRAEGDDGF